MQPPTNLADDILEWALTHTLDLSFLSIATNNATMVYNSGPLRHSLHEVLSKAPEDL